MTKEGNAKARTMYEKAIELDQLCGRICIPGLDLFIDAWSGWTEYSQALERSSEMVQKAIALDDSLPGAYALLSQVDVLKDRHYDRGIADAKRAIALDPNSASGYYWLGQVLILRGNLKLRLSRKHRQCASIPVIEITIWTM